MCEYKVFVGAFADEETKEGIYIYSLDEKTGKLSRITSCVDEKNPTFMAPFPDNDMLYVNGDSHDYSGARAYRMSKDRTKLFPFDFFPLPGFEACHISASKNGRFIVISNFSSSNVISCSVKDNGDIDKIVSVRHHEGGGPVEWYQEKARCHEAIFSADGSEVAVSDLGADRVVLYSFNQETGELCDFATGISQAGDGPRHAMYHPNNSNLLYVVGEMGNSITVFNIDRQMKSVTPLQRVSTLPDNTDGVGCTAAEIQIDEACKYLFVSNRGHDSIVRYTIDSVTGLLSCKCFFPTDGEHCRMFCFDPEERFCFIANQFSNTLIVKEYDKEKGEIGSICDVVNIFKPTYVNVLK